MCELAESGQYRLASLLRAAAQLHLGRRAASFVPRNRQIGVTTCGALRQSLVCGRQGAGSAQVREGTPATAALSPGSNMQTDEVDRAAHTDN
ncbi:unnamed protein product [Vitrella brassicaformis CCMP3155]|uniref:Uncharacterized protein n=1 Tax=Vitrella brassicaformis (strain CCMP3155) TaxID=1169540 RepID=A0A0G4E9B2_VITBC|nr:unnamed protein product [Vitrella brassicaformis CCMP3155]|eukprot:CEL91953.1 unnamed protein product [Vitrella brassicaformis CCMP3155]